MEVTVRFVGVFRSISGKRELTIKFRETGTVNTAAMKIIKELPELKRALIDPGLEDPRPNTLILVNGREISVLNGLETVLKDGDEVVFVPVVHGG
jgi:molybdopterin synthase sulfur carrier subunit